MKMSKIKETRQLEGHAYVSCFVEVIAFSDWFVTSYRDQKNQSCLPYVSLIAEWILANMLEVW